MNSTTCEGNTPVPQTKFGGDALHPGINVNRRVSQFHSLWGSFLTLS
ncbi:MAG TPA: hypothetical protein V6D03_16175 [Candidatus Caenarcaniphilales bacterium]